MFFCYRKYTVELAFENATKFISIVIPMTMRCIFQSDILSNTYNIKPHIIIYRLDIITKVFTRNISYHIAQIITWSASFWRSSSLYCSTRNSSKLTTGTTHPTLNGVYHFYPFPVVDGPRLPYQGLNVQHWNSSWAFGVNGILFRAFILSEKYF